MNSFTLGISGHRPSIVLNSVCTYPNTCICPHGTSRTYCTLYFTIHIPNLTLFTLFGSLQIFAFFDLEPISFTFFFGRGDDNDNGNDSGSKEWVIGLWERLCVCVCVFTRMRGRGKKQDNLRKPPVSRGLPPSPQ
jgi:hypothetical protein